MEQKSAREIQRLLAQPFAPEDLEWRLQTALEEKMRGLAVPYVTNRAIQTRLDEVVGPDHWYNDYKPWHSAGKKESQLCGIAIYFEDRQEWVMKWDGAEDSDIEPVKGGLSDSMKRAAVQWGIGRVLYSMDTVWVDIEKRGRSCVIKDSERSKLDKAYLGMLQSLGLTPASAGGLQSILMPKGVDERPKADGAPDRQTSAKPHSEPAQPVQQPNPTIPSHQTPERVPEYVVRGARVQGGMSGSSSTLVALEAPDGKKVQAFARGARPELSAGTALTAVKLTVRQQDTVAFYVLDAYEVIPPQQTAA